jgi:hypothetical protein
MHRVHIYSSVVCSIVNPATFGMFSSTLLAVDNHADLIGTAEDVFGSDFGPSKALVISTEGASAAQLALANQALGVAGAKGAITVLDISGCAVNAAKATVSASLAMSNPTVVRGSAAEVTALAAAVTSTSENTTAATIVADSKLKIVTKALNAGAKAKTESDNIALRTVVPAVALARRTKAIVACSAAIDFVTDGHVLVLLRKSEETATPISKVPFSGLAASALIAASIAGYKASAFESGSALGATCSALSAFAGAASAAVAQAKVLRTVAVALKPEDDFSEHYTSSVAIGSLGSLFIDNLSSIKADRFQTHSDGTVDLHVLVDAPVSGSSHVGAATSAK